MLRAEQWIMLAVGGLGVYAIYRLATAPKDQKPVAEAKDDIPILRIPVPAAVSSSGPLLLKNDAYYKGRVDGVPTATREDLLRTLQTLGFDTVITYMTPQEAGEEFAIPGARDNVTTGTRWFNARWAGKDGHFTRPPGLAMIWSTTRPVRTRAVTPVSTGLWGY